MSDLTQLSDDDLRSALFYALVERLDAKALEDRSITVVNRMSAAFAVSRRGHLLTLTQGLGLRLLRGDLKWKNHREKPRTFHVDRGTMRSRLTIMPDRIEGTPDEILDRIVTMFLDWTATEEDKRLAVPQRPTVHDATPERRATSARSTQEKTAAAVAAPRQPAPQPQRADKPSADAARPRQAPVREATPSLRTYQWLFEATRRELDRAIAMPASSRYSLIGAGVFVAFTAEAFLNDLGSRVIPSWSQLQRLDPREKAEVLSIELFNVRVDWTVRPFDSVAAALGFRRALAHAHAETLPFEHAQTADRKDSQVPRTRQTAWQEHCDVATMQRWITDVHLLIEHFSRGHDPNEVAIGTAPNTDR